MLNPSKQNRLLDALKKYNRMYLHGKLTELDESGTRLMINHFLTEVLGYIPIEEVKTEYMIRGTYADYVIQTKGIRNFLVEVKSLSLTLSDKHLRQAINYGANEGIEWALLTNGRHFDLYKIIFSKPIESRKVFSFDLADSTKLKASIELLQYLHKESVVNKGLTQLWNKCVALDPISVAGFLFSSNVTNFLKKSLKEKYKHKFTDEDINAALNRLIRESVNADLVKITQVKRERKKSVAPKIISEPQAQQIAIVENQVGEPATSV